MGEAPAARYSPQMTNPRGVGAHLADSESHALLREIVEGLARLPEGLRQTQTDHLWASIKNYVDEWNYNPALALGVPLAAPPQTSGLELITFVAVSVPAGATGVLALSNQQFYVGSGTTVLPNFSKVMQTTDTRTLTISAAGPASIWMTGTQLPTYGALAS